MKIAILTLGTRGDVQPYAVLGQSLQKKGHQVILSTAGNFEKLIHFYGIEFRPIEADYQALLDSKEGKKMMKANPLAIKKNLNNIIYPLIQKSLEAFFELAKESDVVIYHVKTLADSFADQFPDKMIKAMVVPVVEPTREFCNPAFSGVPIPSFLNKWSYKLTALSMKMLQKPIARFRENAGLPKNFEKPEIPCIYGISDKFLKRPEDYPFSSVFTGFWFGNNTPELQQDVQDFIKAGEPPFLITFGSMPFKCKFDIQEAIVQLTYHLKIRIIIVKGWGFEDTRKLEKTASVKIVDAIPFESLFPYCQAIIHHGGIGTTAACLRAGKPFMICPILYPIGDQNFWGKLAHESGYAVKPVPLKDLTEEILIERTTQLMSDETLVKNAEKIRYDLSLENGVKNAVDYIEKRASALQQYTTKGRVS